MLMTDLFTVTYPYSVHFKLSGDLKKVKEYYDRALSIRLKTVGPENIDDVTTNNDLSKGGYLAKTNGVL